MKKTHHTTEQIIRILREAETGGQSHEELCRQHNISSQTFYRWKSKYGGMGISEAHAAAGAGTGEHGVEEAAGGSNA